MENFWIVTGKQRNVLSLTEHPASLDNTDSAVNRIIFNLIAKFAKREEAEAHAVKFAAETNRVGEFSVALWMPDRKPPKVKLTGESENVFAILGRCQKALRNAGFTPDEIDRFRVEASSGDYDHAIQTAMKWCEVR